MNACMDLFHLQTWTVYMELYARDSMGLILEFWQKLIGQLAHLMGGDMPEIVSVFFGVLTALKNLPI